MEVINFLALEERRFKWSMETFTDATPSGSLNKAISEFREIKSSPSDPLEYVDFIMCLLDCAQRLNIAVPEILKEMTDRIVPTQSQRKSKVEEVINVWLVEILLKIEHNKPLDASIFANTAMLVLIMANDNNISILEILRGYEAKIKINKNRVWIKNPDNSYSHKKD